MTRHAERLKNLRSLALGTMRFLKQYEPRLTGSVARGSAHDYSDINIHVFSDTVEDVILYLMHQKIPYHQITRRFNEGGEQEVEYPTFVVESDEAVTEITVFPTKKLRQAPLSHIDQQPMQRLTTKAVEELLAEEAQN